jgi:hypothetical protein
MISKPRPGQSDRGVVVSDLALKASIQADSDSCFGESPTQSWQHAFQHADATELGRRVP